MPSALFPAYVLGRLARPTITVARMAPFEDAELEPSAVAQAVTGTMAPEEVADVLLEMLGLEALDTGKYHAMVIQDPRDKRSIRGFFHLSVVEIPTMASARRFTSRYTERGIANLIRAVNEWTDIRADISHKGDFDSQELFKTPWIYGGTAKPFQLTASELQNVGEYLVRGGFFFAEEWVNIPYSFEGAKRAFTHMFEDGLATQGLALGRDWVFERLPGQHPIFHCFFDFQELPPGYWWSTISSYPQYLQSGLMGATIGGRLVGCFNHKTLIEAWSGRNSEQKPQQSRALQFGVNAIVFALTQEGCITHRVMEEVR